MIVEIETSGASTSLSTTRTEGLVFQNTPLPIIMNTPSLKLPEGAAVCFADRCYHEEAFQAHVGVCPAAPAPVPESPWGFREGYCFGLVVGMLLALWYKQSTSAAWPQKVKPKREFL